MSIVAMPLANGESSTQYKRTGERTASRRYFVTSNVQSIALTAQGLPSTVPGSSYDGDPRLLLDNVNFSPSGGGSYVELQYSTDGRYGGGTTAPTNPEDVNESLFDSDVMVEQFQLPYQQYVNKALPSADGTPPGTVQVWEFNEKKPLFVKKRSVVRLYSREVEVTNVRAFDNVYSQYDVVHTIQGIDYLFLDMQKTRVSRNRFNVTYRWQWDRGLRIPAALLIGNNDCLILLPDTSSGPTTPDAQGLVQYLLPYHRLVPISSSDPTVEPNSIDQKPMYGRDPDGWRSFPGIEGLL